MASGGESEVVFINFDEYEELITVPGIGKSTAWNIIMFRKHMGNITVEMFKKILSRTKVKCTAALLSWFNFTLNEELLPFRRESVPTDTDGFPLVPKSTSIVVPTTTGPDVPKSTSSTTVPLSSVPPTTQSIVTTSTMLPATSTQLTATSVAASTLLTATTSVTTSTLLTSTTVTTPTTSMAVTTTTTNTQVPIVSSVPHPSQRDSLEGYKLPRDQLMVQEKMAPIKQEVEDDRETPTPERSLTKEPRRAPVEQSKPATSTVSEAWLMQAFAEWNRRMDKLSKVKKDQDLEDDYDSDTDSQLSSESSTVGSRHSRYLRRSQRKHSPRSVDSRKSHGSCSTAESEYSESSPHLDRKRRVKYQPKEVETHRSHHSPSRDPPARSSQKTEQRRSRARHSPASSASGKSRSHHSKRGGEDDKSTRADKHRHDHHRNRSSSHRDHERIHHRSPTRQHRQEVSRRVRNRSSSKPDRSGSPVERSTPHRATRMERRSRGEILRNLPRTLCYNGSGSWLSFKQKLTRFCSMYKLTDIESMDSLCWCLTNKAEEHYSLILERRPDITFRDMMRCLERRFGTTDVPETAMARFQQAVQSSSESLEDWADRIMTLSTPAFVGLSESYADRQTVLRFCQGLLDKEAAQYVCTKRHASVDQAVRDVHWYQYCHETVYASGSGRAGKRKPSADDVSQVVTISAVQEDQRSRSGDPTNTEQRLSTVEKNMDSICSALAKINANMGRLLKQKPEQLALPPARSTQSSKSSVRCFKCNQMGHYRSECPELNTGRSDRSNSRNANLVSRNQQTTSAEDLNDQGSSVKAEARSDKNNY